MYRLYIIVYLLYHNNVTIFSLSSIDLCEMGLFSVMILVIVIAMWGPAWVLFRIFMKNTFWSLETVSSTLSADTTNSCVFHNSAPWPKYATVCIQLYDKTPEDDSLWLYARWFGYDRHLQKPPLPPLWNGFCQDMWLQGQSKTQLDGKKYFVGSWFKCAID